MQPLSTIAAHFVRPYLALCGDRAAELGLDTVDFEDPEARVDYAKALRTFELAERTLGREDLGLVGAQHHAGSLRILEYLSRVCRTPLEALQKSSRYQNLIHDACLFTVENDGRMLTARMASQAGVPFSGMVADFFMASLVLGLYRLGVPPDGARVRLVRALPRDPAPFESLFRCALEFGADENSATRRLPVLASHLVFASDGVGVPEWDLVAVVRYRSRRDFAALVTSPEFAEAVVDKWAALESNVRVPVQSPGFFTNAYWLVGALLAVGVLVVNVAERLYERWRARRANGSKASVAVAFQVLVLACVVSGVGCSGDGMRQDNGAGHSADAGPVDGSQPMLDAGRESGRDTMAPGEDSLERLRIPVLLSRDRRSLG